jgi:hypothetical protein
MQGSGGIVPNFLTFALGGGEWSASRWCHFTPGDRAPGAHWVRCWLSPSLEAMEKRIFSVSCRESDPKRHSHRLVPISTELSWERCWMTRRKYAETITDLVNKMSTLHTYSLGVWTCRNLGPVYGKCPFSALCFCVFLLTFSCYKLVSTPSSHLNVGVPLFVYLQA